MTACDSGAGPTRVPMSTVFAGASLAGNVSSSVSSSSRSRADRFSSTASTLLRRCCLFEFQLGLEALPIASDRRHGELPAATHETDGSVVRVERTADSYGVPALAVTHVSDRH